MKTPDSIHCRPGTTDAMQRLADENEALRAERDQATEAVANMDREIKRLDSESKYYWSMLYEMWKPSGLDYDRNIHNNPDAKAWADLFVETFPNLAEHHETMIGWFANAMMAMYDHVKNKEAKQEAHIRAAGAREALERAVQEAGFSGTVVRVDVMREIIEQMESES